MRNTLKRVILIGTLIVSIVMSFYTIGEYYFHAEGDNSIRLEGLKKEEPYSLDIAMIGPSDIFYSVAPGAVYEYTNLTSYVYGISSARINMYKTMLNNILETQNPKLLIVEVHGICYKMMNELDDYGYAMRTLYDSMPYSVRKLKEIDYAFGKNEYDLFSFVFPKTFYHGIGFIDNIQYKKRSQKSFLDSLNFLPLRGAYTLTGQYYPDDPIKRFENCVVPIGKETERYLVDFLEYCKEIEYDNILFINVPTIVEKSKPNEVTYMANYIGKIIQSYGYDFVNFQYAVDDIGIDYYSDYCNTGHMNIYGQEKFTKYLSDYIPNHYDLEPTFLSAEAQKSWEYSTKAYHIYYSYADEMIKQNKKCNLYDSPEFIEYLKQQLGEEGLVK